MASIWHANRGTHDLYIRASTCLLVLIVGQTTLGQEWTRFRGPNGSGLSDVTTVPTSWSEDDYNWTAQLPGSGHSSPVLWGNKLFVTCGDGTTGDRFLVCVAADTGQQIWSRRFGAGHHPKHALNSFASPTPTVDAQRVYTCWGTPRETVIVALDHDGSEIWRRDIGPFKAGHGFGVSLMLYNELLIMPNEQQGQSSWVALQKDSGEVFWQVARDSKLHYSTPCVLKRPDASDEIIITNWEYGICGVDPETGRIRWNVNGFDKSHIEASIASPLVAGRYVIGVCGWLGHGNEVLTLRLDETGRPARIAHRISRGAPLCCTPLVKDDLLFLWSDQGLVTCADVANGTVHWQKRVGGKYYSSPICIDRYIYNSSTDGTMVVVTASREFKLVARNQLPEGSHATPAVAHGTMFLRTLSQVISIGG